MRRSLVLGFVVVVVTLAPLPVHADEPPASPASSDAARAPRRAPRRAPGRERMRDIGAAEATVGAILGASVLGAAYLPYPEHPVAQWRGGILFDDATRGVLKIGSPADRQLASTVSDVLVSTLILAPVLVDALLMAWLVRGDAELMGRMLLMDLQAHAIAQGLTTLFKHAVGRERPVARACREDLATQSTDPLCDSRPDPELAPASFFSGHASLAFTSAALICMQNIELGLYGPEGGAAMCATGLALATSVGLLRIAADKHYASDVLLGAAVGMLSGWLVPWLLHFDVAEAVGVEGVNATIAPIVDDRQIGVQVMGVF